MNNNYKNMMKIKYKIILGQSKSLEKPSNSFSCCGMEPN